MQVRISSNFAAAICLIVAVLISAKPLDAKDDILTTAAKNGSFNTLVSLVVAADLDDALQSKGDFTVFAPTDAAFELLPKETLAGLRKTKNRDQLKNILTYHVIDRSIAVPKHAPSHPLKSAKTLMRFTQFYNNAKCTTTRASIVTGLYPRFGRPHLRRNMVTIGEVMGAAGYKTTLSGGSRSC